MISDGWIGCFQVLTFLSGTLIILTGCCCFAAWFINKVIK